MDIKLMIRETYDQIANTYGERNFDHFWVEEFDYFARNISGKKVIDLGCGAGRDAKVFTDAGFDYTGIDASTGMLRVASARVPGARFLNRDFCKTCLADGEFDGFWASASLLHLPKSDICAALCEAKRITKKGGVGFVSVKERIHIEEELVHEERYGGAQRFFAYYEQHEFTHLLEMCGFTVLHTSTHIETEGNRTTWLCFFVST